MAGKGREYIPEKGLPRGESIGKGDFYLPCLCRTGTSGLWSSGRPTPDGGAGNGKKTPPRILLCTRTKDGITPF